MFGFCSGKGRKASFFGKGFLVMVGVVGDFEFVWRKKGIERELAEIFGPGGFTGRAIGRWGFLGIFTELRRNCCRKDREI